MLKKRKEPETPSSDILDLPGTSPIPNMQRHFSNGCQELIIQLGVTEEQLSYGNGEGENSQDREMEREGKCATCGLDLLCTCDM